MESPRRRLVLWLDALLVPLLRAGTKTSIIIQRNPGRVRGQSIHMRTVSPTLAGLVAFAILDRYELNRPRRR